MHWRRKWQPTPVSLPGKSQGRWSLVGWSMGSHRVRHDWSDLAAAAAFWFQNMNNVYWFICLVHTVLSACSLNKKRDWIWSFRTVSNWYAYAAVAKSLQLCPTLCNPTDGSPPGSSLPGILQERTLEWVAISYPMHESKKRKWSRSVVSES